MIYLVAYDIEQDKVRKKLATRLLAIGLERMQKSVYLGTARKKSLDKLLAQFRDKIGPADKIYALPITREQLGRMQAEGPLLARDLLDGSRRAYVV